MNFSFLASLPSLSVVQVSVSSTSYEISWSEYDVPGVTVEYYIVCIKRDQSSTDCDDTEILPPSQLSYTVTNELSGEYFVCVSPQTTEYGLVAPTECITVLGPVDNLSCTVLSSSELACSWDEYVATVGALSSYVLCIRKDPSASTCDVIETILPSATSYTISGLDSNTVYYPFIFASTFTFTLANIPTAVTTFADGKLFVCIISNYPLVFCILMRILYDIYFRYFDICHVIDIYLSVPTTSPAPKFYRKLVLS